MLRLHPDARQLGRLQELTDAALGHLELEELLGALLERTRRLLDADTCAILLLDEESNELVARAAVGIEEEVEHGVRVPVGKGFAGRVAATQQPVILRDVDHADVLNPILREKGIKSLLGVPLVVQGSVLGVLRANFVAIASHELRTPAASVYGAVATLFERADDLTPEMRDELLRIAYEQGGRLSRLLDQLLDLSRLESRRIRVSPKPIVLQSVLSRIARETLPQGTSLELEVPDDLR